MASRLSVASCPVLVGLVVGCGHPSVEKLPSVFLVPSEAHDISSRTEHGGVAVKFSINAPFPATDFLASARSRLEPLGWRPLQTDWLNPSIPSSHVRGWTFFHDATAKPPAGIHQWLADWQNGVGDIVMLELRYSSPATSTRGEMAAPANANLQVTEMLIPADAAKAMQGEAVRSR